MKNKNFNIYKDSDLIVQISNYCDKDCDRCYIKDLFSSSYLPIQVLNQEKYLNKISSIKSGVISLRGGEPTMVNNWFEKFVLPAIQMDLCVIIDTDGYFIGRNNYKDILLKLSHKKIFIRVSFDKSHYMISNDFKKMAVFANDAINHGIQFNFYSLGMKRSEILKFLNGTELEKYRSFFYTLRYYKNISRVKLKGEYLRVDGKIFNKIL